MRYTLNGYIPSEFDTRFPFRRDNRRPDGTWEAQDATEDNIKGTSVDRHDPVWPRWRKTPPLDGEGEFVADEPFFDIDEITQTAKFYPPGTPLADKNLDGNPASRQRVRDFLTGNHWRRRLLVGGGDSAQGWPQHHSSRFDEQADNPLLTMADRSPQHGPAGDSRSAPAHTMEYRRAWARLPDNRYGPRNGGLRPSAPENEGTELDSGQDRLQSNASGGNEAHAPTDRPLRFIELPSLEKRPSREASRPQPDQGKGATQHPLEARPAKTPSGRTGESVNWAFKKPPADGFVMQKVEMYELTPDGEKKPYLTKWEFWPVSRNFSHTIQQLAVKQRRVAPTPDDTVGERLELGRRSYAGRTIFVTTEASLWSNARIPGQAKRDPSSSAGDLKVMDTDPGLIPDPALTFRREREVQLR